MATETEITSFITRLAALAKNETARRYASGEGFVLPSVCIAQSAHETGWGTSSLMTKANAFFGIKAGGSWTGKVYTADTWEVQDGEAYNTTANFRAYDTLAESVADYYNLIVNSSRYSNGVSTKDNVLSANATISAIWAGGYATDENYVERIMSIINGRNLTQYDSDLGTPSGDVTVLPPPVLPDYTASGLLAKFVKIGGKAVETPENDGSTEPFD